MRIVLVFATVLIGTHLGANAIASVNELQEQRAEQFCKVNPDYC
jgi:hypothetical protein